MNEENSEGCAHQLLTQWQRDNPVQKAFHSRLTSGWAALAEQA